MLEPAIRSGAVWVYFTTLPMTTQLCCKTGCGCVDSCDSVGYSEPRSSTVDRSRTPRLHLCACGWDCCMTRPESDEGENCTTFCSWVRDGYVRHAAIKLVLNIKREKNVKETCNCQTKFLVKWNVSQWTYLKQKRKKMNEWSLFRSSTAEFTCCMTWNTPFHFNIIC